MKNIFTGITAVLMLSGMQAQADEADTAPIRSTLLRYETALNAGDLEGVMALYADDAVFMAQHSPSSVGTVAVRHAYEAVFKTIDLDIKFDIIEIKQLSPTWAFARTHSAGTVKRLATGGGGPEANQELFVLKRSEAGQWRIARYAFSSTQPARP